MERIASIAVAAALVLAACSGDDSTNTAPDPTVAPTHVAVATTAGAATDTTDATSPPSVAEPPAATDADAGTLADLTAALDGAAEGCDPLDTRQCLLPFPSNAMRADGRVSFPADGMPVNSSGVSIDPTEWNRNDGFSPNTPILTYVAGLDPEASGLPTWTDLEGSLAEDSPVVLVNTATGERVPLWAELDAKAADAADRLLEIHPAVALDEGATYAVGLRGLVDGDGGAIEPSTAFRVYRDNLRTELTTIEDRRPAMEITFASLAGAGLARTELQLAWDFTVASTENIAGRLLHIRDDALAALGDAAPAFTITSALPGDDGSGIAIQVTGTFTVPNYLTADGAPGNRFFYGDNVEPTADAMPMQNGALEAPFTCNISDATAEGSEPAHLVQYGHGLLGEDTEVSAGNVRDFANEHNVVLCATKWAG
ncbi:MAG: hypothetical protein AAB131_03670, partial [Actinomycetota bacterium]